MLAEIYYSSRNTSTSVIFYLSCSKSTCRENYSSKRKRVAHLQSTQVIYKIVFDLIFFHKF